jgi:hypothetical protein
MLGNRYFRMLVLRNPAHFDIAPVLFASAALASERLSRKPRQRPLMLTRRLAIARV